MSISDLHPPHSSPAALLATVLLRLRNKVYKRIYEEETADVDRDGIPDIYQRSGDEVRD